MRNEMPWKIVDEEQIKPYFLEAMQIYADQEAIAYANWLSNQVIDGRTSEKLYSDFKVEIGEKN
jgi:hypothetical protein